MNRSINPPLRILPGDTDPGIKTFNEPHFAWVPDEKSARHQLLVFLPGTGGRLGGRSAFIEMAVSLGYHAVFVMYPNSVASQDYCTNLPDPDVYLRFRRSIVQGGEISPEWRIERSESIENRLHKLLHYLHARHPEQGWGGYLDQAGEIAWPKLAVSGHSQGGGHSYIIGKYHEVARMISLGAPKDYSRYFNRPPKVFDADSRTPLTRFFAFNHVGDSVSQSNYADQLETFKQMGFRESDFADADTTAPDFHHARLLFTSTPLPTAMDCHCASVRESLPVCPPAWRYMLTEPV